MSRIKGRGPGPPRDGRGPGPPRDGRGPGPPRDARLQPRRPNATGGRESVGSARRQLRKAMTEPGAAQHGQPRATGRRWPPALAFALVMLGLSALVGLIGGFALATRQTIAAVVFLLFGVAASAAGWSFAHGRRRGYWSAVVVLALVGAVPTGFAIAEGAGPAALVLAPPLVVAGILLRPSVRAELVTEVRHDSGGSPGSGTSPT